MATLEDVRAAKAHAKTVFSKIADVVGVGITQTGADYALKVNLRSQPAGPLPQTVDGVPVLVEIVGHIQKQ